MKTLDSLKLSIYHFIASHQTLMMLANFVRLLGRRGKYVFVHKKEFSGWGMTTKRMPWLDGGGTSIARGFSEANDKISQLVADGNLNLTQFADSADVQKTLRTLSWRHYMVYMSASLAINNTDARKVNFAECGVCDGLTVFFALLAARDNSVAVDGFLYDSWDVMKPESLMDAEKSSAGKYEYLDIENTRKNLSYFDQRSLHFNKGYIPEVFESESHPDSLVWLHIDLNSATPTIQALDFFWNRVVGGGVVLLDDYAYPGYEPTKGAVDSWTEGKSLSLIQLPTGQAMIVKSLR